MSPRIRFVVALTIAIAVGSATYVAQANRWNDECRYWRYDGRPGYTTTELKKLASCLAHKYGVSASTTRYVIGRESGWTPSARNGSSGACGMMQHYPCDVFKPRLNDAKQARPKLKPFGDPRWSKPRQNIAAGVRLAARVGWGPWSL